MNPVSLEAIRLLLGLIDSTDKDEEKKRLLKMVDNLVFIMEKDIEQAYQKYATVKLV
jgi:hypothetical protein